MEIYHDVIQLGIISLILLLSIFIFNESDNAEATGEIGEATKGKGKYNTFVSFTALLMLLAGVVVIDVMFKLKWVLLLALIPTIIVMLDNVKFLQVIFSWRTTTALSLYGVGRIISTVGFINSVFVILKGNLSTAHLLPKRTYNLGILLFDILSNYLFFFIVVLFVVGIGIRIIQSKVVTEKLKRLEKKRLGKHYNDFREKIKAKHPEESINVILSIGIFIMDIIGCFFVTIAYFLLDALFLAERAIRLANSYIWKLCEVNKDKDGDINVTVKSIRAISMWSIVFAIVFEYCFMACSKEVNEDLFEIYSYVSGIVIIPMIISRVIRLKDKK